MGLWLLSSHKHQGVPTFFLIWFRQDSPLNFFLHNLLVLFSINKIKSYQIALHAE